MKSTGERVDGGCTELGIPGWNREALARLFRSRLSYSTHIRMSTRPRGHRPRKHQTEAADLFCLTIGCAVSVHLGSLKSQEVLQTVLPAFPRRYAFFSLRPLPSCLLFSTSFSFPFILCRAFLSLSPQSAFPSPRCLRADDEHG